jgi:Tol biopolymer transport system component
MRIGAALLLTAALAACDGSSEADSRADFAPFGTPEDPQNERGLTAKDLGALEPIEPERIFEIAGKPYALPPPVNSSASEYNPELSANGLRLYFSSRRPGGEGSNDLYVATRQGPDQPFTEVENLGPNVNTPYWETGPTLTDDELELYYTSKRDGSRDLYVARRNSVDERFGPGEKLPEPLNGGGTDSGPYVSGDGLDLMFSSIRKGNLGHRDLFHAARASREEPWGEPQWMGEVINSESSDSSPAMSADKLTLFFHTRRRGGSTNHDIMMSQRASLDASWEEPKFLSFNTPEHHHGTPSLSVDGRALYMRSNSRRNEGEGLQDIWVVDNPFGQNAGPPRLAEAERF